MGDVIPIGGITKLDVPVDKVLEAAKGEMEGVVIMGFDKQGKFYSASTYADGGTVMWLMESCKKLLMETNR